MTNIDKVFENASGLTDSQKKAKQVFGRLLIALRKENAIKIYSLLANISDIDMCDNVINIRFSDKSTYLIVNNEDSVNAINKHLKNINSEYLCELELIAQDEFDMIKCKQFLQNEFGKIITFR